MAVSLSKFTFFVGRKSMKKVVVSVTNDLSTDQRVQRSISILRELGFAITFVGRKLPQSLPFEPGYETVRFKLWFNKGFLFYANYNLRLFWYLLWRKFDLYLSNDLDTLLPNYLVSSFKGKPLIYDSHEYFTGVPEIQHRPVVKQTWTTLEKMIFPHLREVITVNQSIAELYQKEYDKKLLVVRNISDSYIPENPRSRSELGLPEEKFILINQGAGINVDRGMEEMIEALRLLPEDVVLMLVGRGDVLPKIKADLENDPLKERIIFVPPQPYKKMLEYTMAADLGLSLDKDTNLNYRYSLPNKLFDYIKCGIPVLTSGVVEVRKVVETYDIGLVSDHKPQRLAKAVEEIREKGKVQYSENLAKAAAENNWEQESEKLRALFQRFA